MKITPEQLFKEVVLNRIDINSPLMNNERFPWCVFWFDINGKLICYWNYESEWFAFDHVSVWRRFYDEFGFHFGELQDIMGRMVEKHFNLGEVIPIHFNDELYSKVKEHFSR